MAKSKYSFTSAQAANKAEEQRKDAVAHGKAAAPKENKQQQKADERPLRDMTIKELQVLASERGIKVNQRTKKADLINAIETGVSPVQEDVSKPGPKTGTKRGKYNLGTDRKVANISFSITQRELEAIEARMKEDRVSKSVLIRAALDTYLGIDL